MQTQSCRVGKRGAGGKEKENKRIRVEEEWKHRETLSPEALGRWSQVWNHILWETPGEARLARSSFQANVELFPGELQPHRLRFPVPGAEEAQRVFLRTRQPWEPGRGSRGGCGAIQTHLGQGKGKGEWCSPCSQWEQNHPKIKEHWSCLCQAAPTELLITGVETWNCSPWSKTSEKDVKSLGKDLWSDQVQPSAQHQHCPQVPPPHFSLDASRDGDSTELPAQPFPQWIFS